MDKDKGLKCSAPGCNKLAYVLMPVNLCEEHLEKYLKIRKKSIDEQIRKALKNSEGGGKMGRKKGSTNKGSPMAAKKPVKKEEPQEEY